MRKISLRMGLLLLIISAPLFSLGLSSTSVSLAQNTVSVRDDGVKLDFPNTLTFKAHIDAPGKIERLILEYGVEKLTCGTVFAEALPEFTPGSTSADVTWVWDMRKSGSEPPGSHIWYRWYVIDQAGASTLTDKKTVLWLDSTHNWDSISRDKITFHWYGGTRAFAQDLLDSASNSLTRLAQTTGIALDFPVDMYIYANTTDMKDAILYEPNWTGGQAFPESAIVIIGISPDQVDWGKKTEAHELTHLLVGHLTFSCLESIPTWLNEGIAVYGEGGPEPESKARLQTAITQDTLMSARVLSGGFSESSDKADLSYSESYSMVNYLVTTFGRDKMLKLFGDLRDDMKTEDALRDTYNFTIDGLEDGWRASVGAKSRSGAGSVPSPTVQPTVVPTYQPSSDAPLSPALLATAEPQETASPQPTASVTTSVSSSRTGGSARLLTGIAIVVSGILIFGTSAFYIVRRWRATTV